MEFVILIAAIVVSWLVFTWLLRVVKTTLKTALLVAIIVLILQLSLGIGPDQLWQKITELPQLVGDLLSQPS